MKVSNLEKGMLLECDDKSFKFIVTDYGDEMWLRVAKPEKTWWTRKVLDSGPDFVMYLGTKKDVNKKTAWSDRFVLVGDNVVCVDPTAWRRIKVMNAPG